MYNKMRLRSVKTFFNSDKKVISFITMVFLASRVIYYLLGVRFMTLLGWQTLDLNLLKNNLAQSIVYLHSQPPMLNLFLGILLKIFNDKWTLAAHLIFIILGLVLSISLYLLAQRLGASKIWSLGISLFFIINPASILYENLFFYSYLMAVILGIAALFLHKFISQWRLRDGITFFSLGALAILTRSLFHPIWFLGTALLLLIIFKEKYQRKLILASLIIPLLVIGCWYGKNIYLFGVTEGSSWAGMNLAHITMGTLSQEEKEGLVQKGVLSQVSLMGPFLPQSQCEKIFPVKETGIKVLDQDGMNSICYIPASKQLLKDSVNLILYQPMAYIKSVIIAYYIYFLPSSNYSFIALNRLQIDSFNRIFNTVMYGKIFGDEKINASLTMHSILNLEWFVIGLYLLITIFVIKESYNFFVKKYKLKPEYIATLLFMYGTILYVMIIGNFLELGENHRFRFMTDPLFFVLAGIMLFFFFKRRRLSSLSKTAGSNNPL